MKNLIWIVVACAVVIGVFIATTRKVKPLISAPPADIKVAIETIVTVDPDGVARMTSVTKFLEPSILVTLMHNIASERDLWLAGEFDKSIREELREQPWEVGEIEIDFDRSDPEVFVAHSDVLLYRYAWVEEAAEQLWYSPGIVTRQDGLAQLTSLLKMFGQRVASLEMKSEGIAYWPAGAQITETLPAVGSYKGQSGDVGIFYDLKVYMDEETDRPIVHSHFDITTSKVNNLVSDLRQSFEDVLVEAGVPTDTRTVYIRYLYPIPDTTAPPPRRFNAAPRRWASVAFLLLSLAGIAFTYTRLKKSLI